MYNGQIIGTHRRFTSLSPNMVIQNFAIFFFSINSLIVCRQNTISKSIVYIFDDGQIKKQNLKKNKRKNISENFRSHLYDKLFFL